MGDFTAPPTIADLTVAALDALAFVHTHIHRSAELDVR